MRFQDQLIKSTVQALEDVCRAALAVPADKQDWSPGGKSRSVLNQMQEIAGTPTLFLPLLRDGDVPDDQDHHKSAVSLHSVDACIAEAKRATTEFLQVVEDLPDSRLDEEVTLSFAGGSLVTIAEVLLMPSWNMTYHLGQINQIQLLLGDAEMH